MSHAFVGLVLFQLSVVKVNFWCLPFCFVYGICSEIKNEINYVFSIKRRESIRLSSVITTNLWLISIVI